MRMKKIKILKMKIIENLCKKLLIKFQIKKESKFFVNWLSRKMIAKISKKKNGLIRKEAQLIVEDRVLDKEENGQKI